TRLTGNIKLVAPPGCHASVLLKLVHRDDRRRFYSWWAVAGRHDMDSIAVPYKYTGEETIRIDLPYGMPLSLRSLQPHLKRFIAAQNDADDESPIIIEK